jgi:YVTN family beta-propeller protein
MYRRTFVGACLTLVLLVAVGMPATASPAAPARDTTLAATAAIKVRTTIPVGTSPFGVAANPVTDTIYVANTFDDTVSVISGRRNTVVATITVGLDPFGVATNPVTNTIYVASQTVNEVVVIRGRTNTVVATVGVGGTPQGVAVNPRTKTIYVANQGSNTVSVLR